MIKLFAAALAAVMILTTVLGGCAKKETPSSPVSTNEIKEPEETPSKPEKDTKTFEAVYLGVKDYGAEETNKDHKNDFSYRFSIGGEEKVFKIDNGTKDADGNYDYPIQNMIKEGYAYIITVTDETVVAAKELIYGSISFKPVVKGIPGLKTVANFLMTALAPVGTTLYIYGGGWDWQDEGSSVQTRTLGVSDNWVKFFEENDRNYTFKAKNGDDALANPANSYYPYGGYNQYYYAGLDCSGYAGWVIYNTMETENLKEGYVGGSTGTAKRLAGKGWGSFTQDVKAPDGSNGYVMKPGDVMSINGHVWISLGTCGDGSVVILHSTPSKSRTGQPGGGVQISAIGTSESCEAYALADYYMKTYYKEWYDRYPVYLCSPDTYFTFTGENAGRFSWDTSDAGVLKDPEGLQNMKPGEVLATLFDK